VSTPTPREAIPPQPLLTRRDVAARLQVSPYFAGELLRRGAIRPTRIGRLVRCTEADLAAFIEAKRNGGGQP
jgi:excisionase family DNA binding protein